MPAAKLLQKKFSSWEDLGYNYLLGRRFWMVDPKNQAAFDEAALKLLVRDPKSPWKSIRWKTKLQS